MDSDRYRKVKQVFQEVVECDALKRDAYLLEACAGDPELLREVKSLLEFHGPSQNFIEESAFGVGALLIDKQTNIPVGLRIGPYKIVREIGSDRKSTRLNSSH